MSAHLIFPTAISNKFNHYNSIDYDFMMDLVSGTIMDGLSPLYNFNIDVSCISTQGETLWLSNESKGAFEIANLLLGDMTEGVRTRLFASPIELHGTFYYLAPVYWPTDELFLIVAFSTVGDNGNLLLALAQSLAREASEKLKCHYYLQKIPYEAKGEQRFANMDIQSVEKELIIEVAQACKGKIQQMHQVLNMGRTTLWRKLKQYEINIKEYK